jgi:hypothetical protein
MLELRATEGATVARERRVLLFVARTVLKFGMT